VNFDLPHVPEDYVHRIGRTGRAGSTGEALSLVFGEDRPLLSAIERLINKKIEVRQVEGFDRGASSPSPSHAESERQRPQREPQHQRGPKQGERGPRQGERGPKQADHGAKPAERGPKREERGPKREHSRGSKRDDRAPRYNGSPTPRTSGNSGGMDFNKPYEPSTAAQVAAPAEDTHGRKRPATPVPALFRKKAA